MFSAPGTCRGRLSGKCSTSHAKLMMIMLQLNAMQSIAAVSYELNMGMRSRAAPQRMSTS